MVQAVYRILIYLYIFIFLIYITQSFAMKLLSLVKSYYNRKKLSIPYSNLAYININKNLMSYFYLILISQCDKILIIAILCKDPLSCSIPYHHNCNWNINGLKYVFKENGILHLLMCDYKCNFDSRKLYINCICICIK